MWKDVVLRMVRLQLNWPKEVALCELRPWLLGQISSYGEPLRWAITSVEHGIDETAFRLLKIDVVFINEQTVDNR